MNDSDYSNDNINDIDDADEVEDSLDERLIEFIAQSLVEKPDEVEVYTKQTRRTDILKLQVASDGYGQSNWSKW